MLDIKSLINDKKKIKHHSKNDINFIVNGYLKNNISDQDMTKWLKAIYKNSMNIDETVYYTNAIINSGEKLDFSYLDGYIIDKHSTGGIGDKVSMILGPILAACGCYVPMIVGRFLGHTGGTLDKLESIPGYNGLLSKERFKKIVKKVGISIIGQTDEICPADRKIYSLRGKTDTVASFPLICGSIMSKKIAEGIQGLVLDIKIGNGAFIKNENEADKLGDLLKLIGSKFNVNVNYINSDMNQPLGSYAGLACEIYECMDALNGKGHKDLMNVVFSLGEIALSMANESHPNDKMTKAINSGSAFEIFNRMVYQHGGDLKKINNNYNNITEVISNDNGCLKYINTKKIGDAVNFLTILNGKLDNNAGIYFIKKNNEFINKGDVIFKLFGDNQNNIDIAKKIASQSFIIQ